MKKSVGRFLSAAVSLLTVAAAVTGCAPSIDTSKLKIEIRSSAVEVGSRLGFGYFEDEPNIGLEVAISGLVSEEPVFAQAEVRLADTDSDATEATVGGWTQIGERVPVKGDTNATFAFSAADLEALNSTTSEVQIGIWTESAPSSSAALAHSDAYLLQIWQRDAFYEEFAAARQTYYDEFDKEMAWYESEWDKVPDIEGYNGAERTDQQMLDSYYGVTSSSVSSLIYASENLMDTLASWIAPKEFREVFNAYVSAGLADNVYSRQEYDKRCNDYEATEQSLTSCAEVIGTEYPTTSELFKARDQLAKAFVKAGYPDFMKDVS